MDAGYLFEHTSLGFCWWDLLGVIVLAFVIVYTIVRTSQMKKKQKELEEKLSDLYTKDTIGAEGSMPM